MKHTEIQIMMLIDSAIEVGFFQAISEFKLNPNNNQVHQDNLRQANIRMMAQKKALATAIARDQQSIKFNNTSISQDSNRGDSHD